ncbi:MAG TPA: hypothetical protein P5528_06615 [Steroidobacteraceae bacterium]|nr:hypothetical protein [Steroidobacteraceae bacterium]HRX89103.1 hypothetical protein [Steroidobacteraceae bacterium]
MKTIPTTVLLALLAAGCAPGVSGSYTPASSNAMFQSLTFKSGGKVEFTILGATIEGNYEVEDGKVKLTGPEGSRLLNIDGNCLDGGDGLIGLGRYCRS